MPTVVSQSLAGLLGLRAGGLRRGTASGPRRSGAASDIRSRARAEVLEARRLLASTMLTNGIGEGTLQVTVDAYGSYGSAVASAGDASYNPPGPAGSAGTTFTSGVYFSEIDGYLSEDSLGGSPALPPVNFTAVTPASATSSFSVGGFNIQLTQTVLPPNGAGLTLLNQQYVLSNATGSTQQFQMVRHVDGDLFFVGSFGNDFGGASFDGRFIFEFDTVTSQSEPTAFFGITASGNGANAGFTIQPFPYMDDVVASNGIAPVDLNVINGDANGDRITDQGYDVTVTLADAFVVPAGGSVVYTTTTIFGEGTPESLLGPGQLDFAANNFNVDETAGTVTVNVARTRGRSGPISVTYSVSDATATATLDYTPVTGTLLFADQQITASFTVPILDDTLAEGNESFNVIISAPTGGAILGPNTTATVTILDNERAVQIAAPLFTVSEDGAAAQVSVIRTGPTSGEVTVRYSTAPGTAVAPLDYTAVTGVLTIPDGQSGGVISVPVVPDFIDTEATESFTVTISEPTGAALGFLTTATVEITNIDRPASVYDIQAHAPRGRIEALLLYFNEALEGGRAQDLDNYDLFLHTERPYNTPPARRRIGVRAAEYQPDGRILVLRPVTAMRQNVFYEVNIRTGTDAGVLTAGNQPLDGNLDGTPGDDFVGYFGRGSRLNYYDRNGDLVRLGAENGLLEVYRDVERDARVVRVVDPSPSAFFFGKLTPKKKTTDRITDIQILHLGNAGNHSANPPIRIGYVM
ncbi:MAG TPA: Calx-beta domain-containing protein [Tepidisphaeraceae bacterium]|nr:Calx-beta domain-containing protein [Tepidisphaeraceae bacterium]